MPRGGQIYRSTGLRLQAETPGITDLGNAHVSGDIIANGFLHSYGLMAREQSNVVIGENIDPAYLNGTKNKNIVIGAGATVGQAPRAGQSGLPATTVNNAIVFGEGCTVQNTNGITIGNGNNAVCGTGSGFNEGNIAIGALCSAYSLNRVTASVSVAIGADAIASGDDWSIAIGTAKAKATRCIAIGVCGDPVQDNAPNSIIIDNNGGVPIANSVQIGNPTHTFVKIGAFIIGSPARRILVSTTDGAVTNTAVKTGFLTGGGIGGRAIFDTTSSPATIGLTMRMRAKGRISTAAVAPTLTISMESDSGVVLATSAAFIMPINLANSAWEFDGEVTVWTLGAAGTARAYGLFKFTDATGAMRVIGVDQAAAVILPTNAIQNLNAMATWGTASPSNSITAAVCTLEVIA